jgi:hypothetical protein
MSQQYGRWSVGKATATGGTAFAKLLPPASELCQYPAGGMAKSHTVITDISYSYPTTVTHALTILRPLNWTTFSADAAASQAVVNLTADPGSYSTVYQYPTRNSVKPRTANNLIAASDYVVYQCPDGSYVMDTVASVATLAVTLTTNLPTGGVKAGDPLWFFGVAADTDPTTAVAHPGFSVVRAPGSAGITTLHSECLFTSLHPGDPLIFYSDNATTAGTLEFAAGYYERGEM